LLTLRWLCKITFQSLTKINAQVSRVFMDVKKINEALSVGAIDEFGIFPHLEMLKQEPFIYSIEFGLDEVPKEPGMIFIRGPRQYGKSTWLEQQIKQTIEEFGPGSAYYLNGDEIRNDQALVDAVRDILPLYDSRTKTHRLFIDEITAIGNWTRGMKRLLDGGELKQTLVVTTGSKAADLRRGSERLPGRKGKLDRTQYLFTPVSFAEYKRVCGEKLGDRLFLAYILSGGMFKKSSIDRILSGCQATAAKRLIM